MNRALAATVLLGAACALAPSSAWAGDLFSSIDAVAAELRAPDAARRRDAVDKLDAWPGDESHSLLLVALGDADADVRAHAAASIGRHRVMEALPRLIGALGDPDAHLRASAAEALGALLGGGASEPSKDALRAVDTLERALGDGEHEVREAAVVALGRLPPNLGKRTAVALTGRLDDEAAGVRQRAAEVLGRMREARAVVPLLARLGDTTREVRAAALDALAALGDARAVPAIVRMLKDPADDVRASAVAALGRLQAKSAVGPLVEVLQRGPNGGSSDALRARATFALGQIGTTASIEALVTALHRDELQVAAKEALVRVGARAVAPLCAHLGDAQPDLASVYVELLSALGNPEATPALLDELGRGRVPAENVVDALGAMLRAPGGNNDKRLMVTLVSLLSAPSGIVRRHAAEALRGSVDARAISVLAAATSDDERDVRVIAIGELGRLGAREALGELEHALGSPDESTAAAAARALGQLGDRRAVDPLVAALSRTERRVRREAADALARVADGGATPSLLRAVRTAAPDRRATAIVALGGVVRHRPDATARELLFGYVESNDTAAALAALDALGAMGDRAAVPRLQHLVESRFDDDVRGRALAALGDIGGDEAARTLVSMLAGDYGDPRVRAEAAWALGKLKKADGAAINGLTAALHASAPSVRANAAAALYRLGRAPDELLRLVDDRDPAVRGNAALALARSSKARGSLGRLAERDDDRFARAAAKRAVGPNAAPAPSSDWIALDVVDFDGAPLGDTGYRLVLPDGLQRTGVTDERGVIREESVPAGACTLLLDEAAPPR
ncbi:MAG TPA: HEAT repeat domain-containing protein [Polyangia bacterium]